MKFSSDAIKIKTSWDGIVGRAECFHPERLYDEGNSVAHAVSKVVNKLAKKGYVGRRWQDDNGTRGAVGDQKVKRAGKAKPSTLPQLPAISDTGRMNGHLLMKRIKRQ